MGTTFDAGCLASPLASLPVQRNTIHVSPSKADPRRVGVLGGSGFVGAAVCNELISNGWTVSIISAPRLGTSAREVRGIIEASGEHEATTARLATSFEGLDAVVNAAGLARPTGRNIQELSGANALLPRLVSEACRRAGVVRFVHISSAAVQGNLTTLDESTRYRAESPYARTKALGEQALLASWTSGTTVLRPTSVHGPDRTLTRSLVRFASSPFACVLAPGEAPTPQVLAANVGAAVAYVCGAHAPPAIVLQPWEGWSTSSFLQCLSNHRPFQVPNRAGQAIIRGTGLFSRAAPIVAHHRRLELLWRGQAQSPGWLSSVGFSPPYGRTHWDRMIQAMTAVPGH